MDNQSENSIIVLDNGSGYLKAGYPNLNAPEICIPALIGREILRYEDKMNIEKIKEVKNKYAQRKLIHQMIK